MGTRARKALSLAALLLLAGHARAQVAAPSMVEDELPPEPEPAGARGAPAARPGETVPEPAPPPNVEPAPPPVRVPPPQPGGAAAAAAPAMPGVSISPDELKKLQRPIAPVRSSYSQILDLWQQRRRALREQDVARARAAQDQILEAMRDLAIENLNPLASALVREAERSLAANAGEDALEQARFAVALAPDLADAHLALFRAQLSQAPGRPLAALGELWAALGAAAREPHTVRALGGDLAGALLGALFVASFAAVAVLFLRRLRLFLHDFWHLPVVRAGAPVQARLLALVLVSLPFALRLGPFAAVFALAAAVWLHLGARERAVATAALASVAALPYLTLGAARATAWTGTLAEQVYELEHGADGGERAARLVARAESGMPPALLLALGRHFKRRGELDAAQRWYESAAAADSRSAEAEVNLGNVLFLKGDLEGAKAAYLEATDRALNVTALAAAHYDLSKLYLRLAAVEQSSEARKRAQVEDPGYLERHGSDDDFRANRWLVDTMVPRAQIEALASADPGPRSLAQAIRARIAGPFPSRWWPWLPASLLAALWVLGLGGTRIGPSRACERCGRPACRRCDGQQSTLCGQCVNVFERKGMVEPRHRALKEAQVRRHARREQVAVRVLALAGAGAGQLYGGAPVRGYLFLLGALFAAFAAWFWLGILPPPYASPWVLWGKLGVALPLGLAVYFMALRDAFRRGRGSRLWL